ncbi:MAG: YicC family protein [Saprospiraceae bacterium]|nr:YicC family protein [Saprospiraceae bacterium]
MTGYGRASATIGDKTIQIEIRSVNSKGSDFRVKLPNNHKEKELIVRKWLQDQADRGKIDVTIDIASPYGENGFGLNKPLFRRYYEELKSLADEMNVEPGDVFASILRIPNVIQADSNTSDETEWMEIEATFREAMTQFLSFRKEEGRILQNDFETRINLIRQNLEAVLPYEQNRIEKVKERLTLLLETQMTPDQIDKNRFEQELIYYLEKMDITEEKVRLEQHCIYFLEVMNSDETGQGRKLNFISQEIGREINTLGAKASVAEIQRLIVQMKDELEKIKEQLANIV